MHIGVTTKRTFKINLRSKVLYANGVKVKKRICTRCLRSLDKKTV